MKNGSNDIRDKVAQVKHKEEIMQPGIKSIALRVTLGVLEILVLNNHTGDLIKNTVATTAPPAPTLLTEAAALNPDWYMDAWDMRYIVHKAMVAVLERCSVFVTGDSDDNQIFYEYAGR